MVRLLRNRFHNDQPTHTLTDVELCYQPYKIPKVELIYDWAIVNSQEYAGLDYEVTMKSLYALR